MQHNKMRLYTEKLPAYLPDTCTVLGLHVGGTTVGFLENYVRIRTT